MSEDPPDLVRGTYSTDLNINKIHEAILIRFKYFEDSIDRFKEQLDDLYDSTNDGSKPDNEIKLIFQQI